MCGIGGILRTDGQPIPEEWLDAIDARIAWRGPDGHGRFRDRVEVVDDKGEKRIVEVAFVHRRLSIIDHASGGQPMVSERGRNEKEGLVAVVFNGCIYNHRELRKELQGRGHKFVTDHSDTEVLIHGWREWGESVVDRLEAMYAMALWDRNTASLFQARDWFGEKPLTYLTFPSLAGDPAYFVFSSCVKPMPQFLPARYVNTSKERGIRNESDYVQDGYGGSAAVTLNNAIVLNSPPGCGSVFAVGHPKRDFDDDVKVSRPRSWIRESCTLDEMERMIGDAVALRLEADVPLGCFLSGGVDSSLVAHFAHQQKPDLMTFCVRMPDARYDESPHAERVARHLGTQHRTLSVAMQPAEDLLRLIELLGQPFGDSSILPTYWVSKAAREHVKVALSGDGGDELFLGYERYLAAPFLAGHWWWLRLLPASFLHRAHPKSRWNKLARLVDMARDYPSLGLAAMESIFTQRQIRELIGAAPDQPLPYGRGSDGQGSESIALLRNLDIENYLPGDLLRKVDTASMACGLEVRCPFLDRDLARAALSMPIEQLMPGGQRKGLLRAIARKYLPREIVDRPKMGFAIPIGEWFRDDDLPQPRSGMRTLLLDHLNSAEPFGPIQLNRKAVQRFIDEHMSGKRDHGQRLFTLLTLSIWARTQSSATC